MTTAERAALRDEVLARVANGCEYCRIPFHTHHARPEVDHVIARKHGGTDDPANLAAACAQCNRHKGTDLATLDEAGDLVRLFDPRRQTWDDHFRLDAASGSIVGRTPTGAATAKLLRMNDLSRDALRREASA